MGLLNLAEEPGNVSKACKVMGFSRDTFYRYRELVDEGGIDNLVEKTRQKANHKNRIDQTVEDAVNQIAVEFSALGSGPSKQRTAETRDFHFSSWRALRVAAVRS